jgi:hypothetical protein
MAHLLCTDQPQGAIACWTQASLKQAGEDCQVVGYGLALGCVEQRAFDAVVVDLDRLSGASLSLLTALWKFQSKAPVWLATSAGGRAERLLRRCAASGRAARAAGAGDAVSLRALSALSATALIALSQLCRP